MIVCLISESERYEAISPALAKAIRWLRRHQDDEYVKGVTNLGPASSSQPDILVKCEEPALIPRESARLEAHRKYIDIHVPLKGTETIGWAPTAALKHEHEAYDRERDVAFYGDAANAFIHLKVGQMAVFFPDDAHAPNIGLGNHRKLCVKIPVD